MQLKTANIQFDQNNNPVSQQFGDIYYAEQGGLAESIYVFQQGNQLWERWLESVSEHFTIAETGFGTGLNFFAVTELFNQFRQQYPNAKLKRLFFISFEKYPLDPEQLKQIYQQYPQFLPLVDDLLNQWHVPIKGCARLHFNAVKLDLWFGDIQDNIQQLGDYMQNKVSAWFLDGFNPTNNPDMWNEHVAQNIFRLTAINGSFATYTAASSVRKCLAQVGFIVTKRKGYAQKREMLVGIKSSNIENISNQYPYYLTQAATFSGQPDIAIIGGGVASVFCALFLLQRGAKVSLYCADDNTALNASSNLQGAMYPQLSDDDLRVSSFYAYAFYYAQNRLQELEQIVEFKHAWDGVALCAYNSKISQKFSNITEQNWGAELWQACSAEELSQHIGLPVEHAGGFIPHAGWLAPQQLVQNAFKYAQQLGLNLYLQQDITQLNKQGDNWILVNQQQQNFQHQIVILANGHKITQFEQTQMLPLSSVRGQVSQIATSANLTKLKAVICYDGYMTPVDQTSQTHCIGASHVRNNIDREFSLIEQQENQTKIQNNLPNSPWTVEVDVSTNQARTGIRCSSRDRIPMLGNVSNYAQQLVDYKNIYNLNRRRKPIVNAAQHENLYLIGALASRGLTSAPLLAESLASIIYNEPVPLSQDILHALSPNRSWMRKLLKGGQISD